MRTRSYLLEGVAIALAISGCKSGTEPAVPASVSAASTTPTATAGLVMTTPPTFAVKDASGNILGGVAVTITVTAGGGTLASAPTVTVSGAPSSIGVWTLGRVAGVNTVTVTAGNLPPLVITVTGIAGPPASVAMVAGDAQAALAGTTLANALTAQVRDQFGNGVAGSVVTFLVTAGGGSINPSTVTTDASGNASGAIWRLGKSAVPQTATANAAGFSTVANATVSTAFDVDVRFFGPSPPAEASGAFTSAAARVRAMIIGDIPDIDIPAISSGAGIDITSCGPAGIVVNEIVDDVIIYATVVSIDGPGKILASAGPCIIRATSRTAIIGVMRFDADDIAGLVTTGRLNDIVLHEMMHVVGFGTVWNDTRRPGGVLITGAGTDNPRFIGQLAAAACAGDGGSGEACAGDVAVEGLPAGPGTADSHWRESIFDTELMTGFVEATGTPIPLSTITIQQFADEGYVVNISTADPYTVPAPLASRQLRANLSTGGAETWETVVKPVFEVTLAGQIRRLIAQ
jgi:hypothetical protein